MSDNLTTSELALASTITEVVKDGLLKLDILGGNWPGNQLGPYFAHSDETAGWAVRSTVVRGEHGIMMRCPAKIRHLVETSIQTSGSRKTTVKRHHAWSLVQ